MERLGDRDGFHEASTAEVLAGLGPRVRRARLGRGMTLDALAASSRLSAAQLSRLESGARQPSLAALLNIAAGLGVPVGELLGEPGAPGSGTVVRGDEAPVYEGEGLRFQPLVPEAGPEGLAAVRVIFPAGRVEPEHHRHEGEEWLYVLSGLLRLTLGGEATVLEPGDAASFGGRLPHTFEVLGNEDVEVLLVACAHREGRRSAGEGHPLHEGHSGLKNATRRAEVQP